MMPRMIENILKDVTVLELAEGIAGPFCGQILGDLGARVIKIEPPGGDWSRALQTSDRTSPVFLGCNRNKESISVDLRTPGIPEVIRQLASRADVFIQAYRPGVAERAGLSAADLSAINPRLIYCSISGFGNRGPKREWPGSDTILQAYSGVMAATGEPDRPPSRVGTPIGDTGSGVYAAVGVLALLLRRETTGIGGVCDTSLLEALVSLQTTTFSDFFGGVVPKRLGSRSSLSAVPAEAVPTLDGFLSISCHAPRQWQKLCTAIERPDLLDDPRFRTNRDRVENHDLLIEMLSSTLTMRTTSAWMEVFEELGVNAGPINTVVDVVSDPHTLALGLFRSLTSARLKEDTFVVDLPITVDGQVEHPPPAEPPLLGEHTRTVLLEAGYSSEEIDAFSATGAMRAPVDV